MRRAADTNSCSNRQRWQQCTTRNGQQELPPVHHDLPRWWFMLSAISKRYHPSTFDKSVTFFMLASPIGRLRTNSRASVRNRPRSLFVRSILIRIRRSL